MEIKFYLKAEPTYSGKLRVKEWFEARDGKLYQGGNGLWVERPIIGHVDDEIRHTHKEQYDAWRKYVDEHNELYDQVREEYLKEHRDGELG